MKPRDRLNLLRTYGSLYFRHLDAGADSCFYCGERRECLDHRPPLASLSVSGPKAMREAKIPLVLLPSCNDCNRRLGDKPLLTTMEAVVYLKDTLEKLYERGTTLWDKEETMEMSDLFQRMIRARRESAELLVGRIRHLQERELDYDLMPVFFEGDDA